MRDAFRVLQSVLMVLSLVKASAAFAAVQITLVPNPPSPQNVGVLTTWTATVQNGIAADVYDFQFSGGRQGQPLQVLRDFNVANFFTEPTVVPEGTYQVSVIVRDTSTQPMTIFPAVTASYVLNPLISPSSISGAVQSTTHPLVALFSAPACPAQNQIRVRFRKAGSASSSTTNASPCLSLTSNFYVAGMLPDTVYSMNWEQVGSAGSVVGSGPPLSFATGSIPASQVFPTFTVLTPAPAQSQAYPVILHDLLNFGTPYTVTATDLSGNVIWYSPIPFSLVGHPEFGGDLMGIVTGSRDPHQQLLIESDLAGNIVRETNASILNEQLVALAARTNQPPITIDAFHHEARRLSPSNNFLVFGKREVISTSAQGGTSQNPVDILGDVILVLDPNMQLIWYWDSFAHEDINRMATLNDVCIQSQPTCPPFNPAFNTAQDWLHSNSAQLTADGNLVVSQRSQDWVLKINYQNGAGDGSVIWRMGNQGDFTIMNPAPTACAVPGVFQWFTHQHDPEFQLNDVLVGGAQIMTVFDDGNTRQAECDSNADSRGMAILVDEPGRLVYILAADLGAYSGALGAAQVLNYSGNLTASFNNGFIGGAPTGYSQTVEIDMNGGILFKLQANTASTYRTFRMTDLYTPAEP